VVVAAVAVFKLHVKLILLKGKLLTLWKKAAVMAVLKRGNSALESN
jgi:hypothetical protein